VKANPDSPQWPVRQRALEDGKLVYMAVPRLAEPDPFFLLDPDHLADTPAARLVDQGRQRSARTVPVEELEPVDLIVTGCVAVSEDGTRLGKGGGFSDLEAAIAAEAGLIDDDTVVVTTVHELQVLPAGAIPATDHDVRVDLVVTPDRVLPIDRAPAPARRHASGGRSSPRTSSPPSRCCATSRAVRAARSRRGLTTAEGATPAGSLPPADPVRPGRGPGVLRPCRTVEPGAKP
jgi:5-formyltetrahydrofolate cyclo-ligase